MLKFASTPSPAQPTIVKEWCEQYPTEVALSATNLVPCVVEHDGTTYGDTGLVVQEALEGLVVVVGGVSEKRADTEQHLRKLLEIHGGETGVGLPNEVFIEPVSRGMATV